MKIQYTIVILILIGAVLALCCFELVDWILNRPRLARATQCTISTDRSTCQFDAHALNLKQGRTIELEVTESGQVITCRNVQVKSGNAWFGTCDGTANDANFVTRTDNNSGQEFTYGSIRVGTDVCQIAPNARGQSEIRCLGPDQFGDEETQDEDDSSVEPPPTRARDLSQPVGSIRRNQSFRNDADSILDVMVVWTKEAECGYAGFSNHSCTVTAQTQENMRGLIDLAVEETNTAFELSGVKAQLHLVHAYRDPDYKEPTEQQVEKSKIYSTALSHLQQQADGQLDSVHKKRDEFGADMVHMIVASPGKCGTAFPGPRIDKMFSISRYSCSTGYYSFGHETAHLLGAFHDRASMNRCDETLFASIPYAWRDPNAEFRSINANGCKQNQCDNLPKNGCPRVQRFSNTEYLYNGKPMGNEYNDNAKRMNENVAEVGSYKTRPATDSEPEPTLTFDIWLIFFHWITSIWGNKG